MSKIHIRSSKSNDLSHGTPNKSSSRQVLNVCKSVLAGVSLSSPAAHISCKTCNCTANNLSNHSGMSEHHANITDLQQLFSPSCMHCVKHTCKVNVMWTPAELMYTVAKRSVGHISAFTQLTVLHRHVCCANAVGTHASHRQGADAARFHFEKNVCLGQAQARPVYL